MDFSFLWQDISYLLLGNYAQGAMGGAVLTLLISALAILFATVLGLIFGIILVMFNNWITRLLLLILGFLRAVPVIMLIFWVYFLLPILFSIDAPAVSSVICALSLIYAAYIAHIVKSGLMSLSKGQWQAGLSLGLNRWQVLLLIILPQGVRMMLPSFVNQWVALIKDSSLAYIINVTELTYIATQINGDNYGIYSAEVYLFIGVMYFIFCMVLEFLTRVLLSTRKEA